MKYNTVFISGAPTSDPEDVAESLARALSLDGAQWQYVRFDELMERHRGSVHTILERKGNDALLRLDRQTLLEMRDLLQCGQGNLVVAVDWRLVLDKQCYAHMLASGTMVWIDSATDFAMLLAAVRMFDPVAFGARFEHCEILSKRADLTVRCHDYRYKRRTLDEIAEEVRAGFRARHPRARSFATT